jgi:hypothetical protein
MKVRILLLVAVGALVMALALPASAQAWQQYGQLNFAQDRDQDHGGQDRDNRDRDHDRDYGRYRENRAYQDGVRDGDRDHGRNERWHPRGDQWRGDDRDAYVAGYHAGFNVYRPGDRSLLGGILGQGDHGRQGGQAYRNGLQDGLSYGRHDARARKEFKPTDSNAYGKASNGYNRRYGNFDDYKRDYREGYRDGYQRGYNNR